MNKEILKIKTDGNVPSYATKYSAGIDLYCKSDKDIIIKPKETIKIHTDIYVEIPEGYFGAVYPRSSTGVKKQLMLANTVGIIDSDYRGEIMEIRNRLLEMVIDSLNSLYNHMRDVK